MMLATLSVFVSVWPRGLSVCLGVHADLHAQHHDGQDVHAFGGVGVGFRTCAWHVNMVTQNRRRVPYSFGSNARFGRVACFSGALSLDPTLPLQCPAWQASRVASSFLEVDPLHLDSLVDVLTCPVDPIVACVQEEPWPLRFSDLPATLPLPCGVWCSIFRRAVGKRWGSLRVLASAALVLSTRCLRRMRLVTCPCLCFCKRHGRAASAVQPLATGQSKVPEQTASRAQLDVQEEIEM